MSGAVPQWLQQNTLLQPFTYFQSSAACRSDAVHVGVDEAGRGCVLGAMVYACFFCPAAPSSPAAKFFSSLKIDDSKRLKETQREETFAELTSRPELLGWGVHAVSPEEISAKMLRKQKYSLNEIAFDATISLLSLVINSCSNIQEVFVDTVGPAAAYQAKLRGTFPGVKITVREKADALYRVVGAASIIAKVVRDRLLAAPQFYEGGEEADGGGDQTVATAAATEQHAVAAPAAESEEASSAAAVLAVRANGAAATAAAAEERLAAGEAKGKEDTTAVAAAAAGGVSNVAAEIYRGHVAATPTTVTVHAAKQQRFLSILFHGRQQQQPTQALVAHTAEGRKEKRSTSIAAATETEAEQGILPERDVEEVREEAEKRKWRGPPEERENEKDDKDASAAAAAVVGSKAKCGRAKIELPDGREPRNGQKGQEEGKKEEAAAAEKKTPEAVRKASCSAAARETAGTAASAVHKEAATVAGESTQQPQQGKCCSTNLRFPKKQPHSEHAAMRCAPLPRKSSSSAATADAAAAASVAATRDAAATGGPALSITTTQVFFASAAADMPWLPSLAAAAAAPLLLLHMWLLVLCSDQYYSHYTSTSAAYITGGRIAAAVAGYCCGDFRFASAAGATASAAAGDGASSSFLEATASKSDVSCGENRQQPPKEEISHILKAGQARRKRKAKQEQEEDSSRASAEEVEKEFVAAYIAAESEEDLPLGTGYPSDPTTIAFLRKSFHPVFAFGNIVRFSWATVQQLQQQHGVHVEW